MPTSYATVTQELESLISRAVRLGRLDPNELLATYCDLAPTAHPLVNDERVIDLEALLAALALLPADFVEAPRLLVVPDLARFSSVPALGGALRAGLLSDGSLLVEATLGLPSVVRLASALCVIARELDKAARLLGIDDDEDCGCGGECDCSEGEECACGGECDCGEGEECGCGGGCGCGEDSRSEEPAKHSGGEDEEHVAVGPDGTSNPNDEGVTLQDLDLTELALSLGVDEAALRDADARSGGSLLAMLAEPWALPDVIIHPELAERQRAARARISAEGIVARMAELGLLGRPLHLWIGDPQVSDCLSPYTRELREAIVHWAGSHPDQLGEPIDVAAEGLGEDTLYALARDFIAQDPQLAEERAEADRSVGLQRLVLPHESFEIVDLGRIDAKLSDARLPPWGRLAERAPVLLRIEPQVADESQSGLFLLLETLAESLASVTLALAGMGVEHGPGGVFLPRHMVRWAGEQLVFAPRATTLAAPDFAGHAGTTVEGGSTLSIPDPSVLSAEHVGRLSARLSVNSVVVGSAPILAALCEAAHGGLISEQVDFCWAVIGSETCPNGRPTCASLAGYSALALARLRRIFAAFAPSPRRDRPRSGASPSRPVRIKA